MSIKHWLPLVALLLLPTPALAHHEPRYGSGDIDPYPHNDTRFQVDKGSGLDTGCSSGSLKFTVPIDRYVGEIKGDGTLVNPGLLTEQGVISRTFELIMPAYDIDLSDGEIDEVYFNGHKLNEPLDGANGEWHENQYSLPIEWVKFPPARGAGRKPIAAENEITINIDTNGQGWCTAIDWVQVHFKAMAPLLLIHGIGANPGDAWEREPGVTEYLTSKGIPFEHKVEIVPNGTISTNAQALKQQISIHAQSFGVQKVHLMAHSKGGLDSRGYLSKYYNPDEVKVLSLQTLSTPHYGSVLADISVEARDSSLKVVSQDEDVRDYLRNDPLIPTFGGLLGKGPQLPGFRDLQTGSMEQFNRLNPTTGSVKLYTYSADADLPPDDRIISDAEATPFLENIPFGDTKGEIGTVVYRILRGTSTILVVSRTSTFKPKVGSPQQYREIIPIPQSSPQPNDLAVTNDSAAYGAGLQHFGSIDANHRNMKNSETMKKVLERIRNDFPIN